jgi:hypothetical protein
MFVHIVCVASLFVMTYSLAYCHLIYPGVVKCLTVCALACTYVMLLLLLCVHQIFSVNPEYNSSLM